MTEMQQLLEALEAIQRELRGCRDALAALRGPLEGDGGTTMQSFHLRMALAHALDRNEAKLAMCQTYLFNVAHALGEAKVQRVVFGQNAFQPSWECDA